MSLSCDCDWYPEEGDIVHWPDKDYSVLKTSRRKRCMSCNTLIDIGATVLSVTRYKMPEEDSVAYKIYGDDPEGGIPMADNYLCEECADIYFNLEALGFSCVNLGNLKAELSDYVALYK